MQATLLNGWSPASPLAQPLTITQDWLTARLEEAGWTVTTYPLADIDIRPCVGCFNCWMKTPGECVIPDAGRDVARQVINSDRLILLTPVTFGSYSSDLKKAIDRCLCLISPFFTTINGETHHRKRYPTFPHVLALGALPAPDPASERVFHRQLERSMLNLHAPTTTVELIYGEQSPAAIGAALQAQVRTWISTPEVTA